MVFFLFFFFAVLGFEPKASHLLGRLYIYLNHAQTMTPKKQETNDDFCDCPSLLPRALRPQHREEDLGEAWETG
jgi:hypothetical protein